MRSPRIRLFGAALFLASTVACSEQLTGPGTPTSPSFAISDGAHAGAAHFFFLPPMVPAPAHSGTFDSSLSPVVTICALSGSTCGATVVTFSGAQIQLQVADQAYKVVWKTKAAGLNSETLYRIQVSVGGVQLGYADAWVLNSGNTVKIVDQGQTVATVTGGQLPIRFRIETTPAPSGTWNNNDYITYTQSDWGDPQSTGGALLAARFDQIYGGGFPLTVGSPFPTGHALIFTSATAVHNFLPQSGPLGAIQGRFTDPTTSNAGVFGGEAVSFMLNAQFSLAGHTPAKGGVPFTDLVLCGFPTPSAWNGVILRDFLLTVTTALVAGWAPYPLTLAEVSQMTAQINAAFSNGVPSQFAQDHLVSGTCAGAWNQGDMTSYSQDSWGTQSSAASAVLNFFDFVYTGGLEVGVNGSAGHSMVFTSANAVRDYLPDSGTGNYLTADYVDPSSSTSGFFGGATVALQLNVDFADAGHLPASSGVRFGDLHICGSSDPVAIQGETVRALLARATMFLGGAVPDPTGNYADELWLLIEDVTSGFENGTASAWARLHLVNGPCP